MIGMCWWVLWDDGTVGPIKNGGQNNVLEGGERRVTQCSKLNQSDVRELWDHS
jgi:hypothetical protein